MCGHISEISMAQMFSNVCRKNLQVPINTFNEMQEEIKVECMRLFSLYVILNYF